MWVNFFYLSYLLTEYNHSMCIIIYDNIVNTAPDSDMKRCVVSVAKAKLERLTAIVSLAIITLTTQQL